MHNPGVILQQKFLAGGCFFIGLILFGSALYSLRTGVTLSGRGGPSGPIRREEKPGWFWFYFFVRIVFGPVMMFGGGLYFRHLLGLA